MRLAWFVAWWVVLFWLWLAFSGEWNWIEWVAAAGAATGGATVGVIVREQRQARARFRTGWLRDATGVPLQIVIDFGFLVAALAGGRREGLFRARPSDAGGTTDLAAGRRAFLTVAATFSPNAYVVDIEPEDGTALVHDLVPNRGSEDPL